MYCVLLECPLIEIPHYAHETEVTYSEHMYIYSLQANHWGVQYYSLAADTGHRTTCMRRSWHNILRMKC